MLLRALATFLTLGLAALSGYSQAPPAYNALTGQYLIPSSGGVPLPTGSQLYPQLPSDQVGYRVDVDTPAPASAGWSDDPSAPRRRLRDNFEATNPRFSAELEYLLFRFKQLDSSVPLGTTGPAGSFGLPNANGVRSVSSNFGDDLHNGGRFSLGVWINPEAGYGVEANAFILEDRGGRSTIRSDANGSTTIARPFFDTVGQASNVRLVSAPGTYAGSLDASSSSLFWGAEYNPVFRAVQRERMSVDLIGGFRFYSLEESLAVSDRSVALARGQSTFNGAAVAGTAVSDRFSTQNRFYGGVFGARANFGYERWTFNLIAKVAVGAVREYASVEGTTTALAANGQAAGSAVGGLLAQSGNRGRSRDTEFAVAPDFMAKLWYQVTPGMALFGGYNYMYISNVARPGSLVDGRVNPNTIPSSPTFGTPGGGVFPIRNVDSTEFWAHGASAGLLFMY